MNSLYDQKTNDFTYNLGESSTLGFEFRDTSGNDEDITTYDCKFYLYDPITKDPIPFLAPTDDFSKEHNDGVTGGSGVYYFGDTQFPGLVTDIDKANQILIYISSVDMESLAPGVYFYAVKFEIGPSDFWVPATGNLIINRGAYGV